MNIHGLICSQKQIDDCQMVDLMFDNFQQLPDLNYVELSQFWAVAFTTVLLLWLFSHGLGQLLNFIKYS